MCLLRAQNVVRFARYPIDFQQTRRAPVPELHFKGRGLPASCVKASLGLVFSLAWRPFVALASACIFYIALQLTFVQNSSLWLYWYSFAEEFQYATESRTKHHARLSIGGIERITSRASVDFFFKPDSRDSFCAWDVLRDYVIGMESWWLRIHCWTDKTCISVKIWGSDCLSVCNIFSLFYRSYFR